MPNICICNINLKPYLYVLPKACIPGKSIPDAVKTFLWKVLLLCLSSSCISMWSTWSGNISSLWDHVFNQLKGFHIWETFTFTLYAFLSFKLCSSTPNTLQTILSHLYKLSDRQCFLFVKHRIMKNLFPLLTHQIQLFTTFLSSWKITENLGWYNKLI